MQKVTIILILVFVSAGCSVLRKGHGKYNGVSDRLSTAEVLSTTEKNNITGEGFFIQKAEIKVKTEEGSDNFLASLKYQKPDKYLLSLKSRTGIEAARIFLSGDSVVINDRINRIVYHGSQQSLQRHYGISASLLPVILGDFILKNSFNSAAEGCSEGKLSISSLVGGMKILYKIDCKLMKAISAVPESSIGKSVIDLEFLEFFQEAGTVLPGKIEVRDLKKNSSIEIKIVKIEIPWNGEIDFIPGNNYEIQQLP